MSLKISKNNYKETHLRKNKNIIGFCVIWLFNKFRSV